MLLSKPRQSCLYIWDSLKALHMAQYYEYSKCTYIWKTKYILKSDTSLLEIQFYITALHPISVAGELAVGALAPCRSAQASPWCKSRVSERTVAVMYSPHPHSFIFQTELFQW